MSFRFLFSHFYKIVPLLLLAFAPAIGFAAQAYWVGNPSFSRDFIISGDNQNPAREGLQVSMSALISTDAGELASYRFVWELESLGGNGVWSSVPLTTQAASSGEAVILTADPNDEYPSAVVINHTGTVRPHQRLDPYTDYRLVGKLQRTPLFGSQHDVESPTRSSARRLFHFTNTVSNDNAVNVITTVTHAEISNPFFLDNASDSSKRGFALQVGATVRRWDAYDLAPANSTVFFRFNVELRESGGGPVVPLATSTFAASRSVPTYNNAGTVPVPASANISETLFVRPAAQLDPRKTYEAIVTISHREWTSPTQFYQPGNSTGTPTSRLYHFNGNIHFGANGAVFQNFIREPKPAVTHETGFVSMSLSGLQGHLAGFQNHKFTASSAVGVRLYPDGNVIVSSLGSPIPVTPSPGPDLGTTGNVTFARTNMLLRSNRLESSLTVYLPQGMGYQTGSLDRMLEGTLAFSSVALDSQLTPTASTLVFRPAFQVYVVEETKPVAVAASQISWNTGNGTFDFESSGDAVYVRKIEVDHLANSPALPEERVKADNSGYYGALVSLTETSFTVKTASDSSAKLAISFLFKQGNFKTHFPHGSEIDFAGGKMAVEDDVVTEGLLQEVLPIAISYNQGCVDSSCGDGDHAGHFFAEIDKLFFTPDGGLMGAGKITDRNGEGTLSWGYVEALSTSTHPVFAQSIEKFSSGTFHMTGHFIPGTGGGFSEFYLGEAGSIANAGPGSVHLSAVRDGENIARPGSPEDLAGQHYYAGLNLETGGVNLNAMAVIAGQPVPYMLRSCNKFYVRRGGVTGTLEAAPGTFPDEMTLYGYQFGFKYYGLGFLDNSTSPERSFTSGTMRVPFPSDEWFDFAGLSFTCLGGLDSARLPEGGLAKRLDYWNADIDVGALGFVTSNSCDPTTAAFLTLGVSAYSTLIDEPLHGVIGIRPDGELINRKFSISKSLETEISSRLRLPNNIRMSGPADEMYRLTAISDAYFNDFASTTHRNSGDGRLNFAAKIDVPFFEDLAAHVRTTASKTHNPDAVLHLMGGWEEGGETYFTSTFFDDSNRAYPPGENELLYRNASGASGDPRPYLIHARQSWLNVVHLDYPLHWSPALRSFTAYESTQGADLLVVKIDHQLEYLSAENAEISFGAIYDGMPRINLANFVFNQIDDSTGVLQAMTEALQEEAVGALENGLDSMADLLSDQVDALLEDFLSQTIDPIISDLYAELAEAALYTNNINDWKNAVELRTTRYLIQNTGDQSANVRHAIRQLGSAVGEAASLIHKVDTSLEDVQLALRTISGEIYRVEGGVSLEPPAIPDPSAAIPGLLTLDGDEFPIVKTLVAQLIGEVSREIGDELAGMLGDVLDAPTAELNRLLNEQIDQVRPTLERLQEVIALLDDRIGDVREKLGAGGEFVGELQSILSAADSEIVAATAEIQQTLESFLIADIPSPDRFVEFTEEELKQRIRREIQAKLREFNFIREYQLVLRQHLYDLDLAMKEGIDTAFAQVNTVLRDLLGEFLTQIDDEINGFLGDLDAVVGAGKLDGFAHINGDALRLLRIDAYLQLMVPDAMEFNGYLQIKQLESDGSGSCSHTGGGDAKEVTAGALGVPVSWLSPGMNVDLEAKFTFADYPLGLGGRLEMVEGEIGFEAFTITDLGAAISFGATENYIAAKVGMTFQSYALYGGVFFGQTCSIAPLEMVNTEVATVLGNPDPTFSGAYVYGEAHIPVSEVLLGIPATCMFKITAGVGAGAFYFVEGPTYGGQIYLAAAGEALCLVGISGDISLVGAKVADDLRFHGRGRLNGRVGACPFCVTFGKTITMEYANDSWSFDL